MIAITTRTIPASNTRDARIVAETPNGHRIMRSRPALIRECGGGSDRVHAYLACELARSLNWNPATLVEGETKNGHVFVFANSTRWSVADGRERSFTRPMNVNGLTWAEWIAAAGIKSPDVTHTAAWETGEDPTDWRA